MIVLDGALETTEDTIGIIYEVGPRTEAVLHKIGDLSLVKKFYEEVFLEVEEILSKHGGGKFYLLEIPVCPETEQMIQSIHNVSRLEGWLIKNKIHPLGRTERIKVGI